jgi:hypothetical protein
MLVVDEGRAEISLIRTCSNTINFDRVTVTASTLEALLIEAAWKAGASGCTAMEWEAALLRFSRTASNRTYRSLGTVPASTIKAVRRNCNKKLALIGLELAPRKPPTLIERRQKKTRR